MEIRSASIYACYGSKEDLFRESSALYGEIVGAPPHQALRDHPTAREGIHAMLSANADIIKAEFGLARPSERRRVGRVSLSGSGGG